MHVFVVSPARRHRRGRDSSGGTGSKHRARARQRIQPFPIGACLHAVQRRAITGWPYVRCSSGSHPATGTVAAPEAGFRVPRETRAIAQSHWNRALDTFRECLGWFPLLAHTSVRHHQRMKGAQANSPALLGNPTVVLIVSARVRGGANGKRIDWLEWDVTFLTTRSVLYAG